MFYVLIVLVMCQGYVFVETHQFYIFCQTVYIYKGIKRRVKERELEPESPHVLREVQRRLVSLGGRASKRLQTEWTIRKKGDLL